MDAARAHGVACHRVQVLDFGQVKARRPLAALFASLLGVAPDAGPGGARPRGRARRSQSGRLPADSILHASGLVGAPLSAGPGLDRAQRGSRRRSSTGAWTIVRRLIESACREAPLLLVIEDLHYAGGEEAARLGELAASVVAQPALLVLSTRPDEDPIDAAWRARARGCPLTTLDLAPLTDEESRELAASYPQLPAETVDGCIRRAQGHPLFLDQLLRAADAGETRDARVGAGAGPLARREARARGPADAARGFRARPALSARGARGHAGRVGGRARPAGRGGPARRSRATRSRSCTR